VLVQVVNGNQRDGVSAVGGVDAVRAYIRDRAPPVMFSVRSPAIVAVNPSATLPIAEDSLSNRDLATDRMTAWMQTETRPGARITAGALRLAAIDGVDITDIEVRIGGAADGTVNASPLEYPWIGEVAWE
jgi:hypothetical protein